MTALAADAADAAHPVPIAALHGAVCGFGVFEPARFPHPELEALFGSDALGDTDALARFIAISCADLGADDLSFAVLLPDDEDAPLKVRVEALGTWCEYFLAAFRTGLGMGLQVSAGAQAGGDFGLPDAVQEIIDDLAAIAEVEPDSAVESEGDDLAVEAQLVELQEYVKVGVLLIMSMLSSDASDQTG